MHFTKITAFLFLTSAVGVLAAPTNAIIRRGAARTFAELSIRYSSPFITITVYNSIITNRPR